MWEDQKQAVTKVVSGLITKNRQNRIKIAGMTTVKKLIKQSGYLEDATIFNWQPMESFKSRR